MRWLAVPFSVLLLASLFTMPADARKRRSLSPEVQVQQAQGSLPTDAGPLRGPPEGMQKRAGAAKGGPSVPATCTQQNASSPACYSATQQARPMPK